MCAVADINPVERMDGCRIVSEQTRVVGAEELSVECGEERGI